MPMHQEAWTADRFARDAAVSYPALSTTGIVQAPQNNSFCVSKIDYLRLRNLTLDLLTSREYHQKVGMTKLASMSLARTCSPGTT